MLFLLYAWMPYQLLHADGLSRFFDRDQLVHVQLLNTLGVAAFVTCCVLPGLRVPRFTSAQGHLQLAPRVANRLLLTTYLLGAVGLACWMVTIVNVGGFVQAFSSSYAGGYDDSGYVRDGAMLLLVGVPARRYRTFRQRPTVRLVLGPCLVRPALDGELRSSWGDAAQPSGFIVVVVMGWFLGRGKRPPVLLTAGAGLFLGWLVLFLVTNRQNIYLGSDFHANTGRCGHRRQAPDGQRVHLR